MTIQWNWVNNISFLKYSRILNHQPPPCSNYFSLWYFKLISRLYLLACAFMSSHAYFGIFFAFVLKFLKDGLLFRVFVSKNILDKFKYILLYCSTFSVKLRKNF